MNSKYGNIPISSGKSSMIENTILFSSYCYIRNKKRKNRVENGIEPSA